MDEDEPQMIGEGVYGCVHRPSLRCKGNKDLKGKKVDYTGTLSKLTEVGDMAKEMKQYGTIGKIDKQKKFYTGTPIMCDPEKGAEFNRDVDKCLLKGKTYKTGNVGLIVMKDGGEDLTKFMASLEDLDPEESREVLNTFWWEMTRILQGLHLFIQKGVIHFDLKEDNIVYDSHKNRANFIDFGTLVEMKKVKDDARNNRCSTCNRHWSYPFETYYLNRNLFDDEYKKQNTQLFFPVLNDVFSTKNASNPDLVQIIAQNKTIQNNLLKKSLAADQVPIGELNPSSPIVVLYKELKTPHLPDLLSDYLKGIRRFLEQHGEWTYEHLVEKSLNTIDIFGVGISFMYVLKYAKPYMDPAFFDDMYPLVFRMMTPDLLERYTIGPLMTDYQNLLQKHIPEFAPSLPKNKTKKCPEDKVRNPVTGRCIKAKTKTKAKKNKTKKCPKGKVRNPVTGRCIKAKAKTKKNPVGVLPVRTTRVLPVRTTRVLPVRTTRVLPRE